MAYCSVGTRGILIPFGRLDEDAALQAVQTDLSKSCLLKTFLKGRRQKLDCPVYPAKGRHKKESMRRKEHSLLGKLADLEEVFLPRWIWFKLVLAKKR